MNARRPRREVASPAVNKLKTAEKQQGIYKITKEMVPRRGFPVVGVKICQPFNYS
jgi:hypothetical protein